MSEPLTPEREAEIVAVQREIADLLLSERIADPSDELDQRINGMLTATAERAVAVSSEEMGFPSSRSAVLNALANAISMDILRQPHGRHAMSWVRDQLRRMAAEAGRAE